MFQIWSKLNELPKIRSNQTKLTELYKNFKEIEQNFIIFGLANSK